MTFEDSAKEGPLAVRRSSYGPASPKIGARGARTRDQILDAALTLFAQNGFHETLIDDIAESAHVSRATFYQYFENKDQLFIELAEDAGAALRSLIQRVGPLGPTSQGFDNLHWWLEQWAWVYDRYASVLVQWATIESSNSDLRSSTSMFTTKFLSRLIGRFEEAGIGDIAADDAAATVLAVIERYNYLRHTERWPSLSETTITDLARILQLFLFPNTESSIVAGTLPGTEL